MKKKQEEKGKSEQLFRWGSFLLRMVVCVVCLGVSGVLSAQQSVSFRLEKVNLKQALQVLKEKTGVNFVYNTKDVDDRTIVSANVDNRSVEEALKLLLDQTSYVYERVKDYFLIKKGNKAVAPDLRTVRGIVRDENGQPLPGVNVRIEGTYVGRSTDEKGEFIMSGLKEGVVLVFSFIGYKDVTVQVGQRDVLEIALEPMNTEMEEVVVTGMFNRRAESFTGSATTVRGEDLRRVGNQNLLTSLKNIDPSFVITDNLEFGSDPNKLPEIHLRGKTSIPSLWGDYEGNPNQPLFILDGFETTMEKVYDLNMNLVASVTLLKDAAAKAIYGAKAANGVVVIETVRPQEGRLRVSYTGSADITVPDLTSYNLCNASEKLQAEVLAGKYTANNPAEQARLDAVYNELYNEVARGVDTYWLSQPLRTGVGQKHSLYIDGGDEAMRYSANFSYNRINGVMKGSDRSTLSGMVTLSYRYKTLLFRNNLSVDNNKNTEGANIMLWTKADHEYRKFAFTYEGGGYYSIKNIGSGKYLSVNQESGKSGANVQQSDYKMLWYIIPDEDGYCYILPKSSSTSCLDLTSGTVQKGQNIEIWKYNMGSAQKWQLESVSETSKTVAKISGQTLPDNQTEGASFSIRGKITSDSKITSVKVGIYNTSGETVIGKNVAPNAQSYDLKNLDTSVKFGNLTAGIYRYRVTAANSAGTATLIDKRFAVYKDGQTISIGTYYISIAENTDYALSVDNDKNTSGTNILLWMKADYEYRKFEFSYAGDGYYKIKNVGSGQYLAVTGQSGVSGTNVEQSSTAALWRVLPDGTGSYYLLPDSSSTSCLDLAGGTVQKGQNIEIWQYNMGKAQRWKLQSASNTAKTTAKITGQTQPQNQKEGTSFSIRGEISSDSNLTSVKVGVYDTNGTRQIGKKVNPNAKKYDLKNLDTSIKFGNLTAGVYQYKVTATNSAGTVTLVNKRFAVYKEEQTITAGIYYICSAENTEYALSVDSNKNTSGANILLWTKADNNYRKFAFSYAGEGCYKIKNVGSGKYLSVTGQSGNSGANVEQSSTAALWRVLPDGTGSYYLLPKNSSTSCLDLTGGTAQKGQNIEIWQYNMGKAQRWKLAK